MRELVLLGLLFAPEAVAADVHRARYEQSVWQARTTPMWVGMGLSGLGAGGAVVGLVSQEPQARDVATVQGSLFLAGGAALTSVTALRARDYPLDGVPTAIPGAAALALAGLSMGSLAAWQLTDDPALDRTFRHGALGLAGASAFLSLAQVSYDVAAWQDRRQDHALALVPVLADEGGGVALAGRF